ncbi:glycoside hydrolase/deacetylase [Neocallimastix sp. 'constans']
MALTFDDGPYEYTSELLDTLDEAGIKATFFINGENWWKDLATSSSKQKIIKKAVKGGHQIASHTWAHEIPQGKENIKKALTKLDDLVDKVAGVRPKYFRAPQGHCDGECIKYIESLGYKIIQWDLDTNDWDYKYPGLTETQQRAKRVEESKKILKKHWDEKKKNYLVLMHDVHKHTVKEIVPWLIKNAPSKYKFVTVAECLGDKDGAYNKKGFIKSYVAGNSTETTNANANANANVNATSTVAPVPTTNLTQPIVATNTPIVSNTNANLNTSGAMTNSYNAIALVTFLLYTIYMLF